jgi:hypothetical protein
MDQAKQSLIESLQAAASKPLVQATPALTMIGNTLSDKFFDVTLPRVATVLGAIFLIAQLAYLFWKWRKEARQP